MQISKIDWTRNILILGLAVTGWFLVYQWQQDYGSTAQPGVQSDLLGSMSLPVNGSSGQSLPVTDLPRFNSGAVDLADETVTMDAHSIVGRGISSTDLSLVTVSTPLFNIKINPLGADIIRSDLLKYSVSIEQSNQPFTLLQSVPGQTYVSEMGMVGVTGRDLDYEGQGRPKYQTAKTSYAMDEGSDSLVVPFIYTHSDGIRFTKSYVFNRDSYQVNIKFQIENISGKPWLGRLYGRLIRNSYKDPTQSSGFGMSTFLGGAYLDEQDRFKKISFSDIDDVKPAGSAALNQVIEGGWIALIQHYFLSAWVPDEDQQNTYRMFSRPSDTGFAEYILEVAYPAVKIESGASSELNLGMYLGPKIQSELKETAAGLHLAVDYGYLFFISDALFRLLKFIHSLVGNWGWSIILLTVLIKVFLYPLSAKSYRSMAQMRKVQPKLLALREQHGEDKQKMSQELMKLYQKEKINPLGGCWPMLVQMPIFIALYWALLESVELRQAPFLLWIQDLSVMDPYFVLPLLMGLSMWFQQKMLPDPPDPTQAKIMKLMPVFMTFLFLFFPSGLVLYWLTNNILSIVQQWFNTRQQEQLTSS